MFPQNLIELNVIRCDGEVVGVPLTDLAVATIVEQYFLGEKSIFQFREKLEDMLDITLDEAHLLSRLVRSKLHGDYRKLELVTEDERFSVDWSTFVLLSKYIGSANTGYASMEEMGKEIREMLGLTVEQEYLLGMFMNTIYNW